MNEIHKIHEGPPPSESDYFVSDRDGNLVGWLVPVVRPIWTVKGDSIMSTQPPPDALRWINDYMEPAGFGGDDE